MSALRFLAVATVVIVAGLCTPAAVVPGFSSADVIVLVAPFAVVFVVASSRRRKSPAGGAIVRTPSAGPSAGSLSSGVDDEVRS